MKNTALAHSVSHKTLNQGSALGMLVKAGFASSLGIMVASNAYALPTGAEVVSGDISINQPDASNLVVNQNTQSGIINWQSFDIAKGETTRFIQPDANSVTLNRVIGNQIDGTQIYGTLIANGRLVLIDPNGVFFGAGSRADVAGLVVSSANISDNNFNAGRMAFDQAGRADAKITVEKGALITAADGGLVALVAPTVTNDGVIQANVGTVALGAGNAFTLDFYGDNLVNFSVTEEATKGAIANSGTVSAQGGTVLVTARVAKDVVDNVINLDGVVDASSMREVGGKIIIDGGEGDIRVAGKLDASGKTGGGKITVGTDNPDAKASAKLAGKTTIEASAQLSAATVDGDAGSVYVWSKDATDYQGHIDISSRNGKGGFAEVSAVNDLMFAGTVDARGVDDASMGNVLLDPTNFTVGSFTNGANRITSSTLQGLLNAANYTISTVGTGGGQDGDITVASDVTWNGAGSLTLDAADDIFLNATLRSNYAGVPAGGNVTLKAVDDIIVDDFLGTNAVRTARGNITVEAGDDVELTARVLADAYLRSTLGNITVTAGDNVVVTQGILGQEAKIQADVGTVTINTEDLIVDQDTLLGADAFIKAGGNVKINASDDVTLRDGATITSTNGNVDIDQGGVFFSNTAGVVGAANGSVTINQNVGGSIQNAIDAIGSYGTTAEVALGVGTFNESVSLSKNHFTLTGAGDSTVVNATGNGATVISVTGDDNTVSNFAINGNGYTGVTAVSANGADDLTVKNLKIDAVNTGVYATAGANASIDNNRITAASVGTGKGIHLQGLTGANSITDNTVDNFSIGIHNDGTNGTQIGGNTLTGNTTGIRINPSSNVVVDGDIISGGNTAIEVVGGDNNTVKNTTINSIGGDAISVDGSTNAKIQTNLIGTLAGGVAGQGVNIVNGSTGAKVTGNTINGVGENGVFVELSNNAEVKSNTISNSAANGVFAYLSNDSEISNNGITNSGHNGVLVVDSDRAKVKTNTITGANGTNPNQGDGVHVLGGADVLVQGNTINTTFSDGVEIHNSTNADVDGNFIGTVAGGISGQGVYINTSDNANVHDNTINGGAQNGVFAILSKFLKVNENTISNSAANGVFAYLSDDAEVSGNTLTESGHNGVLIVDSNRADVKTNTITGANGTNPNQGDGVHVLGGVDALVKGNTINDTYSDGIEIHNSATAEVDGNFIGTGIGGISDNGIFINTSDDANVHDNTIRYVGINGVFVDSSASVVVKDNSANGNYRGYRLLDSDDAEFTGNTAMDNKTEGFLVQNSDDATFSENSATYNQNGFVVENGSDNATFTDNTGSNNNVNGFTFNGGESHELYSNTVNDNGRNGIELNDTISAIIDGNEANRNGWGKFKKPIFQGDNDFSFDLVIDRPQYGNGSGIVVNNGEDTTITDNTANDNATNGIEVNDSIDTIISGNTANGNGFGGEYQLVFEGDNAFEIFVPANGSGIVVTDSENTDIDDNTTNSNAYAGIDVNGGSDTTVTDNESRFQEVGVRVRGNNSTSLASNTITDNGIGVFVTDSDDFSMLGDIITDNTTGVRLENSNNAFFKNVVFTDNSTGLELFAASGNALMEGLQFIGGDVGVRLNGAGSSAQFQGNTSSFSGQNFYFIVENEAMIGETLDASQQTFDGVRASDFTVEQLAAAEAKTIDDEDRVVVGDVFYKAFPTVAALINLDELFTDRRELFTRGVFSYAGQTIDSTFTVNPLNFQISSVNLSLLAPAAGGGNFNPSNLNNLTPAAGGSPSDLENLAPAAGGNSEQQLAGLAPSAGGDCGSSFLGAGYDMNYNLGSCAVEQQPQ
jgi:filamentous hemagglutinin family protein